MPLRDAARHDRTSSSRVLGRRRALAAALRRDRLDARAGVGRPLLRFRRAPDRRRARLLRRGRRVASVVPLAGRVQRHHRGDVSKFSGMARTSPRSPMRSSARSWRSFTHRLARYELSAIARGLAGLLCALYPGLIIYSALVMTEPLSALALVVAGWCWARDRRDRPLRGAALFGLVIGLGTLVHPSSSPSRRRSLSCSRATPLSDSLAPAALRRRRPRRNRHGLRVRSGPSVDDSQLPRDGPLHVRLHQRRVEPRHRSFLAGDRSIRNAAIVGRLRGGHRPSAAGRLLARCRARNHSQRSRAMARPRPEEARLHVRSRVVPGRIPPRSRSRSLA